MTSKPHVRKQTRSRIPVRVGVLEATLAEFKAKQRESGIAPIVAHDSYLINLATPDRALREKSLHATHVKNASFPTETIQLRVNIPAQMSLPPILK